MNFLEKIKTQSQSISFTEVISFIDEHYDFTPTRFTNGSAVNEANQNNGSCKIFSFPKLHCLEQQQTLHLFGDFYRMDVLQNPDGTDHQNIRNFMSSGWEGINFDWEALTEKQL